MQILLSLINPLVVVVFNKYFYDIEFILALIDWDLIYVPTLLHMILTNIRSAHAPKVFVSSDKIKSHCMFSTCNEQEQY